MLKFQSLALPNELTTNLSGLYKGLHHDSTMLHESNLLNDLRQFAWFNNNPLRIYRDPAYPVSIHLQAPYWQAQNNKDMKKYSKAMSEIRRAVKWLFGNVKSLYILKKT